MEITTSLASDGWSIIETLRTAPRKEELLSADDLPLSEQGKRYLAQYFPKGVYRHQREAILRLADGLHTCMTTGTASGKSLPFFVAAIEQLAKSGASRVMAVYPLRALAREQEERWRNAITASGSRLRSVGLMGRSRCNCAGRYCALARSSYSLQTLFTHGCFRT